MYDFRLQERGSHLDFKLCNFLTGDREKNSQQTVDESKAGSVWWWLEPQRAQHAGATEETSL